MVLHDIAYVIIADTAWIVRVMAVIRQQVCFKVVRVYTFPFHGYPERTVIVDEQFVGREWVKPVYIGKQTFATACLRIKEADTAACPYYQLSLVGNNIQHYIIRDRGSVTFYR